MLRERLSSLARAALPAALVGIAAAAGVAFCSYPAIRLEPGSAAWTRLVAGVAADGSLRERSLLSLPGLPRDRPWIVSFEAAAPGGGPVELGIRPDGTAGVVPVRSSTGRPQGVVLSERAVPGARLELVPVPAAPPVRLVAVEARRLGTPPPARPVAAFLLVTAATAILAQRLRARLALALGTALGALVVLAATPLLVWATLPAAASLARLALPLALLAAGAALAGTAGHATSRAWVRGTVLLAAVVFGAWVRGYFLPSTGSWDTEYWKAWMLRAATHGITRVYGDPEAVPAGRFLAQLRGEEELWKVASGGREFVVDYPPLAMAAWRGAWWLVTSASALGHAEAQNVAVKVPAVLGDLAAVGVLLWALRRTPAQAAAMAALYWALPVSWLSSAVLGYLDGAHAPLVVAALVAAGRGRAGPAGVLLAVGALVKPTALIVGPAAALALAAAGAPLRRAVLAALAVVAVVLVPYALDGTLATAFVHVYRILFQGTLSGGYPNPWWVVGHGLAVAGGDSAWIGPVKYARLDTVPFPARATGAALFLLWAGWVAWRRRGATGPEPVALAGAALFYGYGMLAVGVHENHPHPLMLLLFATGLGSARLKAITAVTSTVYVANMLLLSGLGRFHGPRYVELEAASQWVATLRMGMGFDLTLVLAAANLAGFAMMAIGLGGEFRARGRQGSNGEGNNGRGSNGEDS